MRRIRLKVRLPRIPRLWRKRLYKARWYIAGALLAIIILTPVTWYELTVHSALQKNIPKRFIEVPLGSGVRQVADLLKSQGIINNDFAFDLYTVVHGKTEHLHSGVYSLSPSMSIATIVGALSGGQQAEVRLTIPEGVTMANIAQRVQKAHITSAANLLAAAQKEGIGEGYLFPDTYYFLPDTQASVVVKTMYANFVKHFTPQIQAGITAQGITPAQGVILASLVEHEARTETDRKMVSGVFYNRIRKGMTLGSDVSLQYALGGFTHVLTQADLASNSPYNLRSHTGFPPTPIGSPSLESLEAVAAPTPSNYLFFIAGSDGTLHYAATLQEHNANIAKYL